MYIEDKAKNLNELRNDVKSILKEKKIVNKGDYLVIVACSFKFSGQDEVNSILLEKI